MEIYTLVSLCIGIFGASYAALNALRTQVEGKVMEYCQKATTKVEELKKLEAARKKADEEGAGEGIGTSFCEKHCNKTLGWKRVWVTAHIVPASVFFLFMCFMAVWIYGRWDEIMMRHDDESLKALMAQAPWAYFQTAFLVMCLIDLTAVLAAFAAWGFCMYFSGRVGELHVSLMQGRFKDPGK